MGRPPCPLPVCGPRLVGNNPRDPASLHFRKARDQSFRTSSFLSGRDALDARKRTIERDLARGGQSSRALRLRDGGERVSDVAGEWSISLSAALRARECAGEEGPWDSARRRFWNFASCIYAGQPFLVDQQALATKGRGTRQGDVSGKLRAVSMQATHLLSTSKRWRRKAVGPGKATFLESCELHLCRQAIFGGPEGAGEGPWDPARRRFWNFASCIYAGKPILEDQQTLATKGSGTRQGDVSGKLRAASMQASHFWRTRRRWRRRAVGPGKATFLASCELYLCRQAIFGGPEGAGKEGPWDPARRHFWQVASCIYAGKPFLEDQKALAKKGRGTRQGDVSGKLRAVSMQASHFWGSRKRWRRAVGPGKATFLESCELYLCRQAIFGGPEGAGEGECARSLSSTNMPGVTLDGC